MKNSMLFCFSNPAASPEAAGLEGDWNVVQAAHPEEALEAMAKQPFDVLVTDASSQPFLDEVKNRFPRTVRILGYDAARLDRSLKSAGDVHQYVPQQCRSDTLLSAIQRARLLNTWMSVPAMQQLFAQMHTLPSVPVVYLQLMQKLESLEVTAEEIGALIAQDPLLTAKLLQLVNSAYFGLGHNIVSPDEAVTYVGLERARALLVLIHTFSSYESSPAVALNTEALRRHSMITAVLARQLSREESKNTRNAEIAFTGGVLHDLGKLILAVNLPEDFHRVQPVARENHISVHAAEKELFGANHAEIGACILGTWGLPSEIVEAIAFHHEPGPHFWDAFGPVTAVHVANVMAHELAPDPSGGPAPKLDLAYLDRLNLTPRVDEWREICRQAAGSFNNS
jgi:putative nucleotidyltransferase with HDIG domain